MKSDRHMRVITLLTSLFFCSLSPAFANISPGLQAEPREPVYSLYVVSNSGGANATQQNAVVRILEDQLAQSKEYGVLMLGNAVPPQGFPYPEHRKREEAEDLLKPYLELFDKYEDGDYFIVPGENEWRRGHRHGQDYVFYAQQYITQEFDDDAFVPAYACAGPEEESLTEDVVLVMLNTQWMMMVRHRPDARFGNCEFYSEELVYEELENILKNNIDKKVLIAGYHPAGPWGPGLFSSYKEVEFQRKITDLLEGYDNVIYLSGSSRNMQYRWRNNVHYVYSGAGGDIRPVRKREIALEGAAQNGVVALRFYENGEVWMEFLTEGGTPVQRMLYQKPVFEIPDWEEWRNTSDNIEYESIITIPADSTLEGSKFRQLFFGEHYRNEWLTPVSLPVLDLRTKHGGLFPIKQGGGKQTKTLRLVTPDDVEYHARSIQKDAAGVLPEELRNTYFREVIRDQASLAHPYGAYTIEPMSDALGIYRTDPELYWMPNTSLLGKYQSEFGDMMVLLEVRPDEDLSHLEGFGGSENVVSTTTLYEKLQEDNDNEVDAEFYLRSRLFDMVIGDWDRHEDQWRWAEFEKEEKGSIYRAVPRDRDQVFVEFDGLVPWLASRKWAIRYFSSFEEDFEDIIGQNLSAVYLDRSLLAELDREDWQRLISDFQQDLTDDIVEEGIRSMPEEVFDFSGPEIIRKIKSRRTLLSEAAIEYYEKLAEEVDIAGSDKHEFFKVEFLSTEQMRVIVYKTKKEGDVEKQLYQRTFLASETDEVRLYAMDGRDSFHISGSKNPILVRVISGVGDDIVLNQSPNRVTVYDHEKSVKVSGRVNREFQDHPDVNEYHNDRYSYKYTYVGPASYFGYNVDDGPFIGGGLQIKTHGFRHDPYKTFHSILANYAFNTGAFNLQYTGIWTHVIGSYDLGMHSEFNAPNYVTNFYGFGNETTADLDINQDFYNVRYDLLRVEPFMQRRIGETHTLRLTTRYESVKLEPNTGKYVTQLVAMNELPSSIYNRKNYAAAILSYTIDSRDEEMVPKRGWLINAGGGYFNQIQGNNSFFRYFANAAAYQTIYMPLRLTLAVRAGAAANDGDYEFYHGNSLGGKTNLRGYRRDRFTGDIAVFQNTDLRLKLFDLDTYLLSGEVGVLGFNDFGRVWIPNEESMLWHHGYGGGIWYSPYNVALLTGNLAFSEEGPQVSIHFGFLF